MIRSTADSDPCLLPPFVGLRDSVMDGGADDAQEDVEENGGENHVQDQAVACHHPWTSSGQYFCASAAAARP
jgi:hypothetical protein